MKILNLTLSERLVGTRIINEKGDKLGLEILRMSLKIADKFQVESDELKNAGFVEGKSPWKDEGSEKDIELSDDQSKLLIDFIDQKDKDKGFTMDGGRPMISFIDKLKGNKDEK